MIRFFRRRLLSKGVAAFLAVGVCGCSPSDETVSSLVDLFATTGGSFVQIVLKGVVTGLLSLGVDTTNLDAPLSEQSH